MLYELSFFFLIFILFSQDNKKSAEREARVAKEKLEELLKTARSLSTFNVRRMRDLPDAIKAVFETMPENLGEIEDAINSAHARVQLMASADEQVKYLIAFIIFYRFFNAFLILFFSFEGCL